MEIYKDILTVDDGYICHQCNCVTRKSAGLAKLLFAKYPNANTYIDTTRTRTYGTIDVIGNVVNIYAQYKPSKPKKNESSNDSRSRREYVFNHCLNLLKTYLIGNDMSSETVQYKVIYFPYKIGCGLAGGNWIEYKKMIESFRDAVAEYGFEVFICRPV
jgi:hypothetical protein